MPEQRRKSFWRRCRRVARWCRIASLAIALLLLGSFLYFNLVGIPDFLKRPLLAGLRERGINLEFGRLRFRWFAGLVAESVSFAGIELAEGPELSADEVTVQLNYRALARLRLEVESLTLQQGRLILPLPDRDQPTRAFTIDDIRTVLRLLPGDRWELDQFRAVALGGELNVIGSLTNATAISSWRSSPATNRPALPWRTHLRQIIRATQDMQFGRRPQIILNLRGDAAQPSSITADLNFNGADARTRWGHLDRFLLVGRLNRPAGSNDLGRSELRIQIEGADTPWGDIASTGLHVDWLQSVTNPIPARLDWDWRFEGVSFPWGQIPAARFKGKTRQVPDLPDRLLTEFTLDSGVLHTDWIECRTNQFTLRTLHATDSYVPLGAAWQWNVSHPRSRWGALREFSLDGTFERPPDAAPVDEPDAAANWWNHLHPFNVRWSARVTEATVTNLVVDAIQVEGHWSWPHLAVDDLRVTLGDQELRALAEANVISGGLQAAGRMNLDPSSLAPLLPPAAREWAASLKWSQPPEIEAQASLPLEPWAKGLPDWRPALQACEADGTVRSRAVSWRGIEIVGAEGRFRRLPDHWEISGLSLERPEGRLELLHASVLTNGAFEARIHSRIDPGVLRPIAKEEEDEAFEIIQFSSPPDLHAELAGRLDNLATLTGRGRIVATNFVLRGEPVASLAADLALTNRFVTATNVQLRFNDDEFVAAEVVGFDLPTTILHLTNATARLLPSRGAPLISPHVGRIASPYRFALPADIRANGWVEIRRGRLADMWFDIAGGPFRYWRFNLPQIQSTLHWVDETLTLTNLSASFYGGRLDGDMFIDFTGKRDPDIRFDSRVQTCDLRALVSDLASPTNKLEGTLSGRWTVTEANTADWKSWDGHGQAELFDGYLWDIPLFGMLTPFLNAIIPGMGNSRFSGGTADFALTNSVFHTRNLSLRSALMRLEYDGTIDFDGNVDARVEARVLRDAWVVGPLVSFVFTPLTKLFEFHVTGTINHVEKEPLYIPKPLLFPLQPFKLLRDIFSGPKRKETDPLPPDAPSPPSPRKDPP